MRWDRVGGGTGGGGAVGRDVGHHPLKGLVGDGVGGDADILPHLHGQNLQLVHIEGHLQIPQVVDDAHRVAEPEALSLPAVSPAWTFFWMMVPLMGAVMV